MEYNQTCIQITNLLDEFVNRATPRYINIMLPFEKVVVNRKICKFKLGHYVCKQTTPTTLNMTTTHVILHVQKVLPFKVLLLKG